MTNSIITPIVIDSSIVLEASLSINYNFINMSASNSYGFNAYWFILDDNYTSIQIANISFTLNSTNSTILPFTNISTRLNQSVWSPYINHQVILKLSIK